MKVSVNLTIQDWPPYLQMVSKTAMTQRAGLKWEVLIGLLVLVGGGTWVGLNQWALWPYLAGLISGLACVFIFIFYHQNHYRPKSSGIFLGAFTYELTPKKLVSSGPLSQSVFDWDIVPYVIENPSYLIISIDTVSGLMIPKRDIAASELEKLKALLYKLDKPLINP